MHTITGHAMDHGWLPHNPQTWPYRFATLLRPVVMKHYLGCWLNGEPAMREVPLEAGARVKIVMVSRFGDVGITEDLTAEVGYGTRVPLEALMDFSADS